MKKLLSLLKLSKTYTVRKSFFFSAKNEQVTALRDVNLDLLRGETLGLVGESGCGKSTLAKGMLKLFPLDSGEFYYGLQPEEFQRIEELAQKPLRTGGESEELRIFKSKYELLHKDRDGWFPYRRKMQMIFQNAYASFNPGLKIRKIMEEPLMIHGNYDAKDREQLIIEMLGRVGLSPDYLRRYPKELSGGQQQRVCIARALILRPEFIIADEPVSLLDGSVQSQIINLLNDLKKEMNLTMLFISHDLSV
ncbi:MAG: dipeptide/oligopeptide/nickel ABC transporter ATP-binding protein, partial [Candidatus Wallbacteria bacterium]|nr:dipeptide/oligopeptide/nickel ABC transporter ATP-binding protein [Candidatus Wallbacteria bacterium]